MSLPDKLPGAVRLTWVKITPRAQTFVILSKVEHWLSHWDNSRRRSRKCGGSRCALCQVGSPKQLRFVLLVKSPNINQTPQLLELREIHRDTLEKIIQKGTIGVTIKVKKEGAAANSPVHLEMAHVELAHVIESSIQKLVDCLGLPPIEADSYMEEQSALTVQHTAKPAEQRANNAVELFAAMEASYEVTG